MTTEITAQAVALRFVEQLVPHLESHSKAAAAFNDLPSVPWNLRQQIRTIEGKLDGILDECIELVSKLGTDEAENYLEEYWPVDED